jgi:hypothetical protein
VTEDLRVAAPTLFESIREHGQLLESPALINPAGNLGHRRILPLKPSSVNVWKGAERIAADVAEEVALCQPLGISVDLQAEDSSSVFGRPQGRIGHIGENHCTSNIPCYQGSKAVCTRRSIKYGCLGMALGRAEFFLTSQAIGVPLCHIDCQSTSLIAQEWPNSAATCDGKKTCFSLTELTAAK